MAGMLLIIAGAGVLVLAVRSVVQSSQDTLEAIGDVEVGATDNGDLPWDLSLAQFRACFPELNVARSAQLYEPFIQACFEADIATRAQLATFIAQLGHESLGLRVFTEYANGAAYEGRADLGNVEPGDGPRFKGRGALQLTGRANYRAAGAALGVDLELVPELAAGDAYAFRVAAWFWRQKRLNALADRREFAAMTRAINGGLNGQADRETRLAQACRVMGIVTAWT